MHICNRRFLTFPLFSGQVALQVDERLVWRLDLAQPLFSSFATDLSGSGFNDTLGLLSSNSLVHVHLDIVKLWQY